MKRSACTLGIILAMAGTAVAQMQPFDMSPERSLSSETSTPSLSKPVPSEAPAPGMPVEPLAAPQTVPVSTEPARRYIIPSPEFVLAGEHARRSWSIYLTPEQAASGASINLGYQNAIVVAPEISRLRVTLNGTRLIDSPVASPGTSSGLKADIPDGLLRAGLNDITIESSQRHRTDCTIESTYELWTQIEPSETFLTFDNPDAMRWRRVEDIRAVGVNGSGRTTFNLVAPSMQQATATPGIVRLAQSVALMANMPNQSFDVSEATTRPAMQGDANVIVGTASDLAGILTTLPPGSETAPTIAMIDDPRLGPSNLVVTGPTWEMVSAAVGSLGQQVDRPLEIQRTYLATRPWRTPDVPMLFGAARLKFSDLGIGTLEFSGRRVRTDFAVGVPADFYANAYGETTILLDAAYSQEVLPGSSIDVYVNDNIAATVPITTSGGEILRHLPIKVTMRHFKPGENTIAIEAVLRTKADEVCAPGATALDNGRFVIFDSSEFVMPDYARIGRTPELGGLSGTGFPYGRADNPVALVMDRTQPETLSAATTLLARIAVQAGRLIDVDTVASAAALVGRNALFVTTISQTPPVVLAQLGIGDESRASWGETVASIRPDTQTTFDQWRDRLRGSGWRGQVSRFEEWVNRTFNVTVDTFRIFRSEAPPFVPGGNASLLVASNFNAGGEGTWTLVTAPTVGALREGMDELTSQSGWAELRGHITTFGSATGSVSRIPAEQIEFIETVPYSFSNFRLIAANWLSSNALAYGLAVTVLCIFLGLATAGLLGTFGRRR
nr:cellulose biosynthesis cyclic di-GMP-binding regulatory protein BcsB [Mesorhizobium sp.]